ncbi:MAG: ABC transporter ATP-binding protein [Chloroflexota bacterium]|jgi:NitT/TauT family transport system ATP-binding protein|nr:ABC transporter ATP-binding protein [Chloroflexota bacterium]
MIHLSQLSKVFASSNGGILPALGPLNLTINAGEFVCLVGPSGCGKSTLLRILAELDSPSGGSFQIAKNADRNVTPTLVFQGDSTFPWMTVFENVGYGLRMQGVDSKDSDAIVEQMLRTVGLSQFAESYPYQLSGGMKQRVALARAWANDPAILLMDEPFGALDEQTRLSLQHELLHIWELGDTLKKNKDQAKKTVLFVTHSIDEALVLGDRVLVMSQRPGLIRDEISVPFARPRDPITLKRDPLYGELAYRLWQALK